MRFVRHLEDEYGSLVEVLYYCCRICFSEELDPEIAALSGGARPCLDTELAQPEACRVCGELIGPEAEGAGDEEEPVAQESLTSAAEHNLSTAQRLVETPQPRTT